MHYSTCFQEVSLCGYLGSIRIQAIIEYEGVILLMMCLVPREEYVKPFLSSTFSCFLSPRSANVIHSSVKSS